MPDRPPLVVVQSPSGRESVATKARRYLAEGRVRVQLRVGGLAVVVVRGTEGDHEVRWEAGEGWSCTCPAGEVLRMCAHRVAVGLIVAPDPRGAA